MINSWNHFAYVYTNATNTGVFYLNGAVAGTFTGVMMPLVEKFESVALGTLYCRPTFGTSGWAFHDELRIWKIALTAAQISADKDADAPYTTGLVGYWNGDSTATGLVDSSSLVYNQAVGMDSHLSASPTAHTAALVSSAIPWTSLITTCTPTSSPTTFIVTSPTAVTWVTCQTEAKSALGTSFYPSWVPFSPSFVSVTGSIQKTYVVSPITWSAANVASFTVGLYLSCGSFSASIFATSATAATIHTMPTANCATCSATTQLCLTCQPGFFFFASASTCLATCPAGTTVSGNTCQLTSAGSGRVVCTATTAAWSSTLSCTSSAYTCTTNGCTSGQFLPNVYIFTPTISLTVDGVIAGGPGNGGGWNPQDIKNTDMTVSGNNLLWPTVSVIATCGVVQVSDGVASTTVTVSYGLGCAVGFCDLYTALCTLCTTGYYLVQGVCLTAAQLPPAYQATDADVNLGTINAMSIIDPTATSIVTLPQSTVGIPSCATAAFPNFVQPVHTVNIVTGLPNTYSSVPCCGQHKDIPFLQPWQSTVPYWFSATWDWKTMSVTVCAVRVDGLAIVTTPTVLVTMNTAATALSQTFSFGAPQNVFPYNTSVIPSPYGTVYDGWTCRVLQFGWPVNLVSVQGGTTTVTGSVTLSRVVIDGYDGQFPTTALATGIDRTFTRPSSFATDVSTLQYAYSVYVVDTGVFAKSGVAVCVQQSYYNMTSEFSLKIKVSTAHVDILECMVILRGVLMVVVAIHIVCLFICLQFVCRRCSLSNHALSHLSSHLFIHCLFTIYLSIYF